MQEEQQKTDIRETNTLTDGENVRRQTVTTQEKTSGVVVAQRIIWYVVGVISVIVALRFVLLLLGANQSAGFVDLVYGVSGFFVAPFIGIFGEPSYGTSVFEISSLLAIAVYLLIGWGLAKLITVGRPREEV